MATGDETNGELDPTGQENGLTVYLLREERRTVKGCEGEEQEVKEVGRTYVGATVDLKRRLRQHNRELKGGARRTAEGGPWSVHCHVVGFRTFQECLQFEHAWRRVGAGGRRGRNRNKNRSRKGATRGVGWRMEALSLLMQKERWSSKSCLASEVALKVIFPKEKEEEEEEEDFPAERSLIPQQRMICSLPPLSLPRFPSPLEEEEEERLEEEEEEVRDDS